MNSQKKIMIARDVDYYIHANKGRIDLMSIPKAHVTTWALSKKWRNVPEESLKKVAELPDREVRLTLASILTDVGDIIVYAKKARNLAYTIIACQVLIILMGMGLFGADHSLIINTLIVMFTSPLWGGLLLFFNWKKNFWSKELLKHVCENYDVLEEYNTLP